MQYAIYPGTVETYDGEIQTFTVDELAVLYGVDQEFYVDANLLSEKDKLYFIQLRPRRDGIYDNMYEKVELGDEIKWGPDFDGKKKYTMETDYDALYSAQNAELKP